MSFFSKKVETVKEAAQPPPTDVWHGFTQRQYEFRKEGAVHIVDLTALLGCKKDGYDDGKLTWSPEAKYIFVQHTHNGCEHV